MGSRQLILAGIACLALTLATQATARADTPGSGFNDWNCRPSAAHPEPVVLLHGLGGNGPGNFATLGPYLAGQGFCVYTTTYGEPSPGIPVGGLVPIPQSATEIASFIGSVLTATGAAKADLVGHSEGGFQSLYGPKFVPGEMAGIARVVAVAPPTHGTTFGDSLTIAGALGILPEVTTIIGTYGCPACSELSTGSDLVNQLNTGPVTQPGIAYTIIASTHDELVTPYGTEFVSEPGVSNQTVQTLCPLDPVGHIGLIYDPDVEQMIRNALDPADPVPVTCSLGLPI
jgi:triacylglycerol esterase/lipase EstA (alpha/beta hydrolase family)